MAGEGKREAPRVAWIGADLGTRPERAFAWAIAVAAASIAVGELVAGNAPRSNLVMVELLGLFLLALRGHRRASLLMLAIAILAFAFLWLPPRYSFAPADARHLVTLAVMLVVGVAIALVSTRLVIDLGKHAELERQLRRLNRALLTVGGVNRALREATDEAGLTREICRVAVEVGGYRLAWIGYAEHDAERTVRPVAQAGFEDGYLEAARVSWGDTERGRGPTGMAIRSAKPEIARDIRRDPRFAPWRDRAIARGFASSIALPIVLDEGVLGAFMVYAVEPDAFDPEEVGLLAELAQDVALGIRMLRERALRERQEEELRLRTAELQQERELNALKSNLINLVSHDLRAPITSIMGYTEFLEEELGGPLTPRQRQYTAEIFKGADRLDGMVSDLLDSARLESGTFQLELQPLDLAHAIREVASSLRPQLDGAGVDFEAALPDEPFWIEADRACIGRVLHNLMGNAIKFSPAGGAITVRLARAADGVRCEVEDAGIGIAPEDVPKLFQRFSQLEAGRRKGGTGLGLSICKAFVEAHGGTIGVRSAPDQGSVFWFVLPTG